MTAAFVRSGPKTRAAPPRESQTPPGEPASTGTPGAVFLHKSERSLVAGVYVLGDVVGRSRGLFRLFEPDMWRNI